MSKPKVHQVHLRAFMPMNDGTGRHTWRFYVKGAGFTLPAASEHAASVVDSTELSKVARKYRNLRIVADPIDTPEPVAVVEIVMTAAVARPITEAALKLVEMGLDENRLQYILQRYCSGVGDPYTNGIHNEFRSIKLGIVSKLLTPAQVRRQARTTVKRVDSLV